MEHRMTDRVHTASNMRPTLEPFGADLFRSVVPDWYRVVWLQWRNFWLGIFQALAALQLRPKITFFSDLPRRHWIQFFRKSEYSKSRLILYLSFLPEFLLYKFKSLSLKDIWPEAAAQLIPWNVFYIKFPLRKIEALLNIHVIYGRVRSLKKSLLFPKQTKQNSRTPLPLYKGVCLTVNYIPTTIWNIFLNSKFISNHNIQFTTFEA